MTQSHVPMKAEYNQGNDMGTKLLEKIIPRYNRDLRNRMILECKAVVRDAEDLGLKSNSNSETAGIVPWTIRGAHGEPSHYTIKFVSPVVLYVPPAFASLHLGCRYTAKNDVEYVPCYIMNLNRVALAKFYQSAGEYSRIGSGLFIKLDFSGGKRAELSSTNIFLPGGAEEHVQDLGQEAIRKCLEHCWWHLPAPKDAEDMSCMHNMPYHTSQSIKGIIQLRKTILRVIKIHRQDERSIMPGRRGTNCIHADVALLVDDGKRIFSEKRAILISTGLSPPVKEDELVNAIIATHNIRPPKVFMVIGRAAQAMQPMDMRPVFSLAVWKILQHRGVRSSLTVVEDMDEIVARVSDLLQSNAYESDVFYPGFVWKFTRSNAKKAVSELFPLYVREGNSVYHLPPAVISFLATSIPSLLSKAESVSAIARLFDLVSTDATQWGGNARSALKARKSQDAPASSALGHLLTHVPPVAADVALSRIFAKYAGYGLNLDAK